MAVVGVPKTIDNDILLMDKTFGFDTAVEEAQRAINSAYIEVHHMPFSCLCVDGYISHHKASDEFFPAVGSFMVNFCLLFVFFCHKFFYRHTVLIMALAL